MKKKDLQEFKEWLYSNSSYLWKAGKDAENEKLKSIYFAQAETTSYIYLKLCDLLEV